MRYTGIILAACCVGTACSVLPFSSGETATCTIPVVQITGVEVTPLDREILSNGQVNYVHSDTLRGQIVFEARTEHETIGEEIVDCPDDPLVDPMPGRVVNPVEPFGHVVRFDQSIRGGGEAIPADINLLEVAALKDDDGLRTGLSPFAVAQVRFDLAIYTFPPGDCRGTFAWKTSDGQVIRDRVDVHIGVE